MLNSCRMVLLFQSARNSSNVSFTETAWVLSRRAGNLFIFNGINVFGYLEMHYSFSLGFPKLMHPWRLQTSKKDVQSFLGGINFYTCFVKGFARIANPIYDLIA